MQHRIHLRKNRNCAKPNLPLNPNISLLRKSESLPSFAWMRNTARRASCQGSNRRRRRPLAALDRGAPAAKRASKQTTKRHA